MDRYLNNGDKITICNKEYTILDTVGYGSSCVVYKAKLVNSNGFETEILLKEYNPKFLKISRDNDGFLMCPNENRSAYEAGLKRFKAAGQKQSEIRRGIDGLKNSSANIQEIVEGVNGTCYIVMSVLSGCNYSDFKEKSLEALLIRIRSLASIIGIYHKEGYLHLDIKPENIFILPETEKLPILFDFDSVTPKSDLHEKLVCSYTQSWAAPEQLDPNRINEVCESSDLFAIGEILFYKLMGRHSKHYERRSFSNFDFDTEAALLKNANPKIQSILTEVFNHTICNYIPRRYKSADELVEILDKAIDIARQKSYLISNLPMQSSFFVGRESELAEIDYALKANGKLFVSGIGGIGKSELVKHYANQHRSDFDTVIYAIYNTDIESMVLDDMALPISNFQIFPDEKPHDYYRRKLNKLKELSDKKVLLIVDNFNTTEDIYFDELMNLDCKMIVTTRCDFVDFGYEQIYIGPLKKDYDIRSIFNYYYPKFKLLSDEENTAVEEILELYAGHTMAVELLAKQLNASRIKPLEMLQKLALGGLSNSGKEKVRQSKDGNLSTQSAYEHIRSLFDVSNLSLSETNILANLSLIPPTGVSTEQFKEWCYLESYDDINNLIASGWIRQYKEEDYISLHPVIADIALDELKKDFSICEPMLKTITEIFNDGTFDNYDSTFRLHLFNIVNSICNSICDFNFLSETCIDFVNAIAMNFYLYGNISKYIDSMKQSIVASENIKTIDPKKIAIYYNTLGLLCLTADIFADAEKYFATSLRIKTEIYSEYHSEIAISFNSLGLLYHTKGLLNDAMKYWSNALKIRLIVFGENHVDTAQSYNNMGILYNDLENFDMSEKNYQKAIDIYVTLGKDKYDDAVVSYNNLGTLYIKYRNYERAEECLLHAYSLNEQIHGRVHRNTAVVLSSLGKLFSKKKNYIEAEKSYKEALDIRIALYGEYHSDTARTYNLLAQLYSCNKCFKEATEYYQKALDIFRNVFGEKHPNTATVYYNIGVVELYMKNYDKAKRLFSTAKKIWLDILYLGDKNHTTIASATTYLGFISEKQGDRKKAIDYYEEALNIRESIVNTSDEDITFLENRIKKLKN